MGNRVFLATLHEFCPKDNKTCIRVTSAHIRDQLDFFGCMLVRVVVRSAGMVTKGFYGTVITSFPAIDVLTVGFVFNSSLSNPKSLSVFD